jgi:hypothetical protein
MNTREAAAIIKGHSSRLGAAADDLNESLRIAEAGLRSRGFTTAASVPLMVWSDRAVGPDMIPGGQLAWLETDDEWGFVHLHPELGFRPLLTGAALKYRVAAAGVLEELLYQLVLAEDA